MPHGRAPPRRQPFPPPDLEEEEEEEEESNRHFQTLRRSLRHSVMKKRKPDSDSEHTETTDEEEDNDIFLHRIPKRNNELLPNAVAIRPSFRMRSKIRESIRQSKIRPAKFEVQVGGAEGRYARDVEIMLRKLLRNS